LSDVVSRNLQLIRESETCGGREGETRRTKIIIQSEGEKRENQDHDADDHEETA
jgi:hypothetical protein